MSAFKELLSGGVVDPQKQQESAEQQFPKEVAAHGLRMWRPGEPFASRGVRYLLGVAARYSRPDLDLLDELVQRIRDGRLCAIQLDVFDMSTFKRLEDFDIYIPGIGVVNQTPVLGVWVDGVIRERLQGFRARQRLLAQFGGTTHPQGIP